MSLVQTKCRRDHLRAQSNAPSKTETRNSVYAVLFTGKKKKKTRKKFTTHSGMNLVADASQWCIHTQREDPKLVGRLVERTWLHSQDGKRMTMMTMLKHASVHKQHRSHFLQNYPNTSGRALQLTKLSCEAPHCCI